VQSDGDRFAARSECSGKEEHRIHAAHFREERNGFRASLRDAQQCKSTLLGSGESARTNQGMLHERHTHRVTRIEEHGEDSARERALFHRSCDHAGNELRSARVSRMRLHDDGAANGERGGGVPSCNRERERKIARAEDDHGPEGPQ
jgi:hypothetical protein